MTTRKTNIGSLPAIPAGLAPDVRRYFEGVAESLQTMQGQRGDKLDRAVRLRDLQPGTTIGSAFINSIVKQIRDDSQPSEPLSPPTNFRAISAFSSVMLVWDYNRSPAYDRTEVFRASVELDANGNMLGPIPQFSDQLLFGSISGDRFNDTISSGYRYFYWVRHVNTSDIPGAFSGPVQAVSAPLPSEILDKIESELLSSEFSQYLSTSIVDPKLNTIQNQINQSIATLDNDLGAAQDSISSHQSLLNKLGPINATGDKYVFMDTISSVKDDQSLLLTRLGAYNASKGRYSSFDSLYQTTEEHALKFQSLGSYDSATNKFAFINTLSEVRNDVTSITNILGAVNPTTGKYAFFADIITANEKGTRIENALGAYNLSEGKYAFQINQQQVNAGTASSLNQLSALTLPFSESLLSERTWIIGTNGPQARFGFQNGTSNSIIAGIGPYSSPTNIWRGRSVGTPNEAGGFHSDYVNIDPTKTYRVSLWFRASESTTIGESYLGVYSLPTTVQNLNGVANGNPYFVTTNLHWATANRGRWLLYVGVIHPAGYTGGDTGLSGVYDPATGKKILAGTPFRFAPGTTQVLMRAYQYYCSTSTTSVLDFAHPRIEVMDGTEPSFNDLLCPSTLKAVITDFSNVSSDVSKIKAERTLKVDANGVVAGFGLLADSTLGSKIFFSANQIEFINTDATDKDLGLGLLIKNGGLYFNKAVAREIVVEDITFKRGIGVDLSVLENLQLPIGKITEANLAPAFLNRIILRDPNAVVTGGNQSVSRTINFANQTGQTGSFVTAPIVSGNSLVRITVNVSLEARETLLQVSRPTVPTSPSIRFRIMRGTTEILIPTDVLNAVNANSYGYTLVRGTGEYILTGVGYVEEGGYTTGGARFWERGVHLSAQFAFDGGYYTGSSGFTLNIIGLGGSIGVANMSMNVFEASSSSDGLIVKTDWANILSKPSTIAGFGIADGVSLNGGNVFLGSGSFRAFSIRNTDPNSWSWFAMGGTSDFAGNVWHIATNGTATDIGLGGALHIRGANGADTSMAINQNHTVRFRSLDLYAGATNSSNGWRLWHDGNAPVFATRWPTLAEIGAFGTSGGTVSGATTFNAAINTNRMINVSTTMSNQDDHVNSPISIRERDRVGSAQSNTKYAPNLNFHWSGFVSSSLWMTTSGVLCWGAYDDTGTPDANGVFSTSLVYGNTFSTIGKGGMVLFNGSAGMVIRTQDAGGGYARGMIAENAAGTRLGGIGFYGDTNNVYSFAMSLKENWWAAPQFEMTSNNIGINNTYLTLTQGWDISWGGRWSSGFPTITGTSATLYMYPNGSSGGAYVLTSSRLEFPVSFDAYMAPAGGGFHGVYTSAGNAKPLAIGSLLVSNAYSDVSRVPSNGLFVKGRSQLENSLTVSKSDVNLSQPIWHPDGATMQLYSSGGTPTALCFHRGGFTAVGLVHNGDGLYLTDGTFRANGFGMNNRATTITTGASNWDAISIQSPYGYIDIGALNSSYAHFTTDRGYFYMNKELSVNGGFDVYGTPFFFGRGNKAKISSFQTRHIDGLSPDGTLYDALYINYINNNDVMIGRDGTAKLIAKSSLNEVLARWVTFVDTRSVGLRPPTGYGPDVSYEFLAGSTAGNSGEGYIGSIVFRPYGAGSDWSGGPMHKLHFGQDSGRIWHQRGNGNGWGDYEEIVKYHSNGYLYARSWINITNGQGLFWGNGTHFFSTGDGAMTLRGTANAAHISMQTNGGVTQGFLYAEAGGNIGFLGQNAFWALRVDANNLVWVTDIRATSDSRLKDDQQVITDALSKVKTHLVGKTYVRKDKGGKRDAGLIAQDVLKALPEAVSVNEKTGYYSVSYHAVIGLLVEAIKELSAKVERLEAGWQQ